MSVVKRKAVERAHLAILGCFLLSKVAWGQSALISSAVVSPPSSVAPTSDVASTFQQEQLALCQEIQAQITNGATQQQLAAWYQRNASRFAAQEKRSEAMAAARALMPMPANEHPNIPANASPTLKAFLIAQITLGNARAQIHNQLLQQAAGAGSNLTPTQLNQLHEKEGQLFQQQNASAIKLQAQRAQTLSNAAAQTPFPMPPPLKFPSNASPQLQAFLTVRDQVIRSQMQVINQYRLADPKAQQAALQKWQQQNAGLLQQMHVKATALSRVN